MLDVILYMPRISVVIPTYNRLNALKKTLEGVAKQSLPAQDFEVIIISDGSSDGTDEYLRSADYPFALHAGSQNNAGPAAARNCGVQSAGSELLLFLDDDVVPDSNLLQAHVQAHAGADDRLVVLGPMLTPPDANLSPWTAWEQALLERYYADMASGKTHPTPREFFTGNVSLKRTLFLAHGGFDITFRRAEDVEFAFRLERAGAHFHFLPEARGYHYVQRSYESWLRVAYQYGQYDVLLTRERGIQWLLPVKLGEYHNRHPWIRLLVPLCLDRSSLQAMVEPLLRFFGTQAYSLVPGLARAALSAVYNLRYYQGMSDQLGGRETFFQMVEQNQPARAEQARPVRGEHEKGA